MSLEMGFSQRQVPRQEPRLRQGLTQEQKQELQGHLFGLQLDLVKRLRGTEYQPKAKCLNCNRVLEPIEILKGFNQDPNDYDTTCPKCKNRFQPLLISRGDAWEAELAFYCSTQALAQLQGLETLTPKEIEKQNPAVYHSLIVHFGSLRKSFKEIGAHYAHEELDGWKTKATSFLGTLPDTVIAGCVGVSSSTIRRYRRKLGVPAYDRQNTVDELFN